MDSSHIIRKVHTFLVTADETEGCLKLGFRGIYKLQVGLAIVQLLRHDSNREVTNWPLCMIRNFGFTSHSFFLNAGTRCKTGEGKFIFLTLEGQKIVQYINHFVDYLRSQEESKQEKKGLKDNDYSEPLNLSKINVKKADSEKIHTEIHKNIIDKGRNKTSHVQLHKNVGDRKPNNEYTHTGSGEKHKGIQTMVSDGSQLAVFAPNQELEEDYYNADLYSHLHRNEPCIQENEYGMSSSSAVANTKEIKTYENTTSSEYDYIS